jgi:hypothetical protein
MFQTPMQMKFQRAAEDLGLEIVMPFQIKLEGTTISAPLLLRNFGDENGVVLMVTSDPSSILDSDLKLLQKYKYYWSISDEQSIKDDPIASYDRDSFVGMLRDWGWTGPSNNRPSWLPSESHHN